jgi:hypothetical protein
MKKFGTWFQGLELTGKVTLISVLTIVFLGVVGVAAQPNLSSNVAPNQTIPASIPEENNAESTTETKIETKTESILYTSISIEENSLAKGKTQIQTSGVNGLKTITDTITFTDGVETNRTSIESITTSPVNEVVLSGTYVAPAPKCDKNYSGCVPIASDVDCDSGSGNGPAYTSGPVRVIGTDIYGLDRNGDGWGCE